MDRCRNKGFRISNLLTHFNQIPYSYQWFRRSTDVLAQGYDHLGGSRKRGYRAVTGDFLAVVGMYSPLKCKSSHFIHPFKFKLITNYCLFGIPMAESSFKDGLNHHRRVI